MRLSEHALFAQLKVLSTPLVPELSLWLLPPEAPAWRGDDPERLEWPYWAFAWPGGQVLARHLLDAPRWVAGRTVLSFGAGGAIEAIAAARAGASAVVCSDLDPLARQAALVNASLNDATVHVTGDDLLGSDIDTEVLLLGDVCYEPALAARVLDWGEAQAKRGVTVLLGDPGRVEELRRRNYRQLGTWLAAFDGDPRETTRWPTTVYAIE